MYVWQMNDGRWHISLKVGGRRLFNPILNNHSANRLYYTSYETEAEARDAERRIRTLIEAAA